VEIALSAALGIAALIGVWRLPDRLALAIALTAGLVLSYHASVTDTLLLLPAVLLASTARRTEKADAVYA
jgi:multisubunit Na+/H+ antiporter MnhG subunit